MTTGRDRAAALVVALMGLWALLCVLVAPGAAATGEDDRVADALRGRDAYVSAAEMGETAARMEERLAVEAARLDGRGLEVKLAVVPPISGEDVFAYAERMRRELGFEGTLLVTTPTGPVGAAGPRTRASISNAFAASGVDDVPSPAERLIAAAELAVPPPPESRSGVRELLVMIGLTLLGGAWAIAWGLRREQRRERAGAAETRAQLKLCLDALRARALALARRPSLPQEGRALVEAALASYAEGVAAVDRARGDEDLDTALARLRAGLAQLERAGEVIGEPQPMDEPFAGLCAVDPGHGPATSSAGLAGLDEPAGVCDECRRRVDGGETPSRRLIPVGGRPVPYDEADIRLPPPPDA